jgi:hypothetical protein
MADIPGFPTFTDEHKQQAATLVQSIKDANPQHATFFGHIESAVTSLGSGVAEGVGNAVEAPLFLILLLAMLLPGGRRNAFM